MDRRLAAILVADVVGYSRLSEADEEGTDLGKRAGPSFAPAGARRSRIARTVPTSRYRYLPTNNAEDGVEGTPKSML